MIRGGGLRMARDRDAGLRAPNGGGRAAITHRRFRRGGTPRRVFFCSVHFTESDVCHVDDERLHFTARLGGLCAHCQETLV